MGTTYFFAAFLLSVACAVIAVTLIVLIPDEPVVNWWFALGQRVGMKMDGNISVERWFFKPLWGCEKCFAGQLCLWLYPLYRIKAHRYQDWTILHFWRCSIDWAAYSLICHLFAVCAAISIAFIFSSYINQLKAKWN